MGLHGCDQLAGASLDALFRQQGAMMAHVNARAAGLVCQLLVCLVATFAI
jgi:hypothetical protein